MRGPINKSAPGSLAPWTEMPMWESEDILLLDANNRKVARVLSQPSNGEAQENARLLALAPDLFRVLVDLVEECGWLDGRPDEDGEPIEIEHLEAAEEVLKRAAGEAP